MGGIIFFHGNGCPHCDLTLPIIEEIEKELSISVDRKEVWENLENEKLMYSFKEDIEKSAKCGKYDLVPLVFNPVTKDCMCGRLEDNPQELKDWFKKQI